MNDRHLDPPDDQDPPEWYMTMQDVIDNMNPPEALADALRRQMESWVDEHNAAQEPDEPEPDYSEPDWQNHYAVGTRKCPHGNDAGHCDACDYAGDMAYDAAREARFER